MGNVELIELKKSSIQCPSCLHYVFEGTLICEGGKLMLSDQDVMNRIKEASKIQKAPHYRTSMNVTRGSKCGPNPWQQHHYKARDALRSATKGERTLTSIWDRWQNNEIYRKIQLAHKEKQAGPSWQRPGYWEAKKELSNLYNSKRQQQVPYIPISDRKRLRDKIGPFTTRVLGMVEYALC